MADGGPEPPAAGGSKDNPFSFKSFITRRATVDGSSGGRGVIEEGSKKLKKKKKNSVLPAVTAAAAVEKEEVPFPDLEPADSNTGMHHSMGVYLIGISYIQWNLSNPDTLGTENSVLIREVSFLISGVVNHTKMAFGQEKVSFI